MAEGDQTGNEGEEVEDRSVLFETLLAEYKELEADIRARIDLQHRNVNILVVLMTAVTGYLVNFWNDHGLENGPQSLVHTEVAILIVIAPLFANVFIWRHLDHDANIIDKAAYIDQPLRENVIRIAGNDRVLDWEGFQRQRRRSRPFKLGPLVLLGNEHVPMLLFAAAYLTGAWYMRIDVADHAGQARGLFDVLLYVSTGLFLASCYMSIVVAFGYGSLGARTIRPK